MRISVRPSVVLRGCLAAVTAALVTSTTAAYTPAAAAAGGLLPLTATQTSTITGLAPGGAPQAVDYTITNPNTAAVRVRTVTITMSAIRYKTAAGAGVGTTRADHPAGATALGCTAADFAIVAPDPLGQDIPPGRSWFTRSSSKRSGTIVMLDTGRDQDDCRGTTATLTLTIA